MSKASNFEFYISKRLVRSKDTESFSKPAVRIAILSIALGLAVMIISVAIVTGFKNQIADKVIGFGSHIRITKFDENTSFENQPISKNQPFYPSFNNVDGIRHIQVYATKAGIVKTENEIQGVVLKGVGSDYDWSFFADKIIAGKQLKISDTAKTNDVLISKILATKLQLQVGDKLPMYFIIDSASAPLARPFKVAGIYETGLEECDKMYVICDIAHIQKLNGWTKDQVAGFEILINDFKDLDRVGKYVYDHIDYTLNAQTIKQLYPQIFDWLELQDMNVIIILALMILVAGINMISTLLILILERTNMIGILKAVGARNWSIRKIFLYNATYLIGKGLIWGNVLGLALCIIQIYTGIFTLPQESYYVNVVPINLNIFHILFINVGTLIISFLMLLIPSYIITRISPVKSIRFN
jgi:lipoprotein-releasing system permease protein